MKRKVWVTFCRLACLVAAIIFAARSSRAESITYTYKGLNFTTLECPGPSGVCSDNPVSTANAVTAFITLSSPLVADFQGLVTPTAWSISDGLSTLSAANGVLVTFANGIPVNGGKILIDTDGTGNIKYWEMVAATPNALVNEPVGCLAGTETCIAIVTFHLPSDLLGTFTKDYSLYYPHGGASTSTPGTWTVPEPSCLVLLAFGLAGVIASFSVLRVNASTSKR